MRRLLATICLGIGIPIALLFGTGAAGDGDRYEVRAIFDNVASAVPGEDVKVAGAKVGTIESMDVTADNRAAVVLKIEDIRFTPFRKDARCTIRPQSLIGEKFVECDPGTSAEPPLDEIGEGEGEGQHLLPVERTSQPVDLDLVNDILRRPYRERLAILLSELGTGVAGRGKDLNEIIHRANPALRETDKVLAILARQNRTLAKLATDSDVALGPLARERERVAGFVENANATAEATAERRAEIQASIRRLPRFLAELRPLMADLGGFAGEATPVVRDLRAAAPDVSRLIRELGPFSRAATPALTSLGEAAATGRPALLRTRPLIQDLRAFAGDLRPVSTNLSRLVDSFDKTGTIERAMDYFFFQMLAINGFDGIGHYLRAGLIVNLCSTYSVAPGASCRANFTATRATRSASRSELDPRLADAADALRGAPRRAPAAEPGGAAKQGSVAPQGDILGRLLTGEGDAAAKRRKQARDVQARAGRPGPGLERAGDPMLDYLLGQGEAR